MCVYVWEREQERELTNYNSKTYITQHSKTDAHTSSIHTQKTPVFPTNTTEQKSQKHCSVDFLVGLPRHTPPLPLNTGVWQYKERDGRESNMIHPSAHLDG